MEGATQEKLKKYEGNLIYMFCKYATYIIDSNQPKYNSCDLNRPVDELTLYPPFFFFFF